MEEKKEQQVRCPSCGLEVSDSTAIRCPRCNSVLLQLVGCSGNCSKCAKSCPPK